MILKTLIIVFFSLFITDILIQLGLFEKVKFIGRYFTKITKLPEFYSITFVTSFGSPTAANTMLVSLQKENKLTRKEIFVGGLFNSLPVYIKETIQYQIPVIIPVLGGIVGIIYFLTFILAGFFKFLFILFLGRRFCSSSSSNFNFENSNNENKKNNFRNVVKNSFFHSARIFSRIAIVYIIVSYLTILLTKTGYISKLSNNIIPILKFLKLPNCVLVPISAFMLSPLVGISSLGTLINNGTITYKVGAISALLGSLLFLPVFAIRSTLPNYTAIFGIKLGSLILTFSTLIGMLTRALVICLILIFWR